MLKVLKYSLGYTFRKKSTPILLALLFILAFGIPLAAYVGGILKETQYNYVKSEIFFNGIISIALIPIFLMFVSYIAVITGQIFKRGEEDGTTLMLVSSRYTRSQVILGRFGAVAVHLVVIAIITALGMSLASWFYQPAEAKYEIISLISIIFGSFFIGMLFASLSLIFSILMGRIGAIVIVVFTFVFVAILSPILLMLSANNTETLNKLKYFSRQGEAVNDAYVFKDVNNNIETQEAMYQSIPDGNKKLLLDELKDSSYATVGWFDVWTQVSQMMGAFDSKSKNPSVLDKIAPISIENTDFFQNLKKLDTDTTIVSGTVGSQSSSEKKVLFGLAKTLNKMANESVSYSGSYFDKQQLFNLERAFSQMLEKVKTNEFKTTVDKYKAIFKQISDYKINMQSQYGQNLPMSAMAAVIDAIDRKEITLTSTSKIDVKTDQNYNTRTLEEFKLDGHDVPSIVEFSQHGQDVVFGDNMGQILKRIELYYAIFDANKGYATDSYQNYPSSNTIEFKEAIQKSFENYFNAQLRAASEAQLVQQLGYTYSHDPIVPGPFIYVFWPAVALGLFGLAFVLHRRADFK